MKTVVSQVTSYFSSLFSDPVTININMDWASLGSGILGQTSNSFYSLNGGYASLKSSLASSETSADDLAMVTNMPASDPIGGTHLEIVTRAQLEALGFNPGDSSPDANIEFSSTFAFDFDRSNGVTAGTYDFYAVVAHEVSEVMGRILFQGAVAAAGT